MLWAKDICLSLKKIYVSENKTETLKIVWKQWGKSTKQSTVLQEEHKYQKETMELQIWEIPGKSGLSWIWGDKDELLEISHLPTCSK